MSMNGLVKTMQTESGDIKLVGNALTFLLYKSYFGRDLLNDIVTFAKHNADPAVVKKFNDFKIKSMDDLSGLDADKQAEILSGIDGYKFDSEFILNFIVSLMATARYPEKPDVIDLIVEVPPHWLADKEIIGELMEFLSLFITQKKR